MRCWTPSGGRQGLLRESRQAGGIGISPCRPSSRWTARAEGNGVSRSSSDNASELQALHAELLREIEERKRSQYKLLQRLNRLSEQSRTEAPQAAAPPQPVTYPVQAQPVTYPSQPQPVAYPAPRQPVTYPSPPQPATYPSPSAPSPSAPSPRVHSPYMPPYMQAPFPQVDRSAPPPEIAIEPDVPEPIQEEPPAPVLPPPLAGPNVMNVVMVGAECAPWSKTGGLGDVMGALPKALRRRGHRVMVVVPRYAIYPDAWDTSATARMHCFGSDQEVRYFHAFKDGVDYVFVDHSCFNTRGNDIYSGSRTDLMFRCSLLCKAAIEAVWHVPCGGVAYGDENLVFIANDWHTALLPVYLQAHYRDYGKMMYARAIFVIHNMAHQGRGPFSEVHNLELNDHYKEMYRLYDPVGGEHMNIMKVGLELAHRLVAVSHGYAWECLTPEGGWGLHQVLGSAQWKLRGIVNGIDYTEWNPACDKYLQDNGYVNYDLRTLKEGKRQCKMALQKELGLPVDPSIPMLGFIGRLDYQKGVDLIRDNYDWLMSENVQLILLGSGREDLENSLREMESRSPTKCRGWVGFSVKMAHRITAGCDILLMPSRFEPCGLNQLYAMAYGTVPVVHAVGGLRDTVQQYKPFEDTGTGWVFDRAEANKLREATNNALLTYRQYQDSFFRIMQRGMDQDLSWDHAAEQYEEVLVAAKYQW